LSNDSQWANPPLPAAPATTAPLSTRSTTKQAGNTGIEAAVRVPAGIDISAAAQLVAVAADITLVIDEAGFIRSVNCGADFVFEGCDALVGKQWADTVTIETKPKVESLINDAGETVLGKTKWRQVNHFANSGIDVPVLYATIKANSSGHIIAFGRDLRATAALQQRLIDAQHSMERDYWRLRNAETRYRLLFQMSSEAVIVLDANTQKIIEANPSVAKMLGDIATPVVGQRFPTGFDARSTNVIESLFSRVQTNGRAEEVSVWLTSRATGATANQAASPAKDGEYFVSASLFRHEQQSLLLVRLSRTHADPSVDIESKSLLDALAQSLDGFVLSSTNGVIIWANQAFADLAHAAGPDKLRGESLDGWLGRTEMEYNVLIANLKQRGAIRLFSAGVRGSDGLIADVEISAVSLPQSNPPVLAFTIRNIGGRLSHRSGTLPTLDSASVPIDMNSTPISPPLNAALGPTSRSVEQLTALVGRMPLKELVGETTDLIEKLCIEAALGLAEDNRVAAAEMLGLSRQSLYVKMRRHGLGDLPLDADS
jgi:transcriptional regulator PpsR